jgi:putative glutamine amidotransferase
MRHSRHSEWLVTCAENNKSKPFYLDWLKLAGITGRAVPDNFDLPAAHDGFDGLLLAGGGDVQPSLYGDTQVHPRTAGVNLTRDMLEIELFKLFVAAAKPVFGICRGIQLMNVALGGGLLQDVHDTDGAVEVELHRSEDGTPGFHALTVDLSTALGLVLAGVRRVNSIHHQAVDPSRVGKGLVICARSAGGIPEAAELEGTGARVCAVQWHPERLHRNDPASLPLIEHIRRQNEEE